MEEKQPDAVGETAAPSEPYRVLARRFRPASFAEIVGQDEVVGSLTGALSSGRVPQAYLFWGSRGIGKTTCARILARALNCEQGPTPEPCGTCEPCRMILDGSATDVVELDAASHNGVDEVRALREQAGYVPLRLRRKVFILDEVHMFSRSAFNALLKILEEPPAHVCFILATTEVHKVPDTVRSRCQVLPFRRIGDAEIRARLESLCEREGATVAAEVLVEIAASAFGGMRDAETALERLLGLSADIDLDAWRRIVGRLGTTKAAELVGACLDGRASDALHYAHEAVAHGIDERECLGEILAVLREVFLLSVDGKDSTLSQAQGDWRERLAALAERADPTRLDAMMQVVVLGRQRMRQVEDRRVLLELSLARLARLDEVLGICELQPSAASPAATPPGPAPTAQAARRRHEAPAAPKAPPAPADPWSQTLGKVTASKPLLGQLLERARRTWRGSRRLELAFAGLTDMQRDLCERDQSRDYVAATLAEAAGAEVELVFVFEDETGSRGAEAPAAETEPPAKAEGPELSPLAKRAADLFGARPRKRRRG